MDTGPKMGLNSPNIMDVVRYLQAKDEEIRDWIRRGDQWVMCGLVCEGFTCTRLPHPLSEPHLAEGPRRQPYAMWETIDTKVTRLRRGGQHESEV